MLPFMQTLAGFSRLYQSLDDGQKQLLDQLLTTFGADWLGQKSDVDPELLAVVSAPNSTDEKVAALAQNPKLLQGFSKPKQALPAVLSLRCPHCESFFVKETKRSNSDG